VYVDFEPAPRDFFHTCEFTPAEAGPLHLERVGRRTVP
jgi:hypothetical protein